MEIEYGNANAFHPKAITMSSQWSDGPTTKATAEFSPLLPSQVSIKDCYLTGHGFSEPEGVHPPRRRAITLGLAVAIAIAAGVWQIRKSFS